MRQLRVIEGKFTKRELEKILGEPTWDWAEEDARREAPSCGLSKGMLPTAGWGDFSACCRIWIHTDGICIGYGMDVPGDRAYAEEVYQKILKDIE